MTANAGYHAYATGDVLTAAQVQYNLQNQTVMYFATTTARDAALTGSILVEGMVSYTPATGVMYYNGSAWTAVGSTKVFNEQKFTANGTWTAPTGVTLAWVNIVSGGGGGGADGHQFGIGIGGAGGAQYTGQFTVVPATGYTVTIGGGGAGASASASASAQGSPGSASVFGSTTIAGGLEGRAGGGGSGFAFTTTGQSSFGIGGTSGGGSAAANSGGGGGGNYVSNTACTGGTGGSGIVIVRWLA